MDHEAVVNDLFDTCTWLGDYHEDNGKQKYLARERDQCLTALLDLDKMLEEDSPESGYVVRQQLGEWQVLRRRMIPLFVSYQKDSELATNVVQLMVKLTTRVGLYGSDELQHLRHLQDYKEAFSKSDIFTVLLRLVMEALDNEAGPGQQFFKDVLVLIRNLVSVPDPGPGDAGYTPLRRRLQLTYIRHFHDEGVLDFFHFLGEQLVMREENNADQVWAVAEILYHICTTFDPQEMWQKRKEQKKRDLSELLARDKADSKLMAPQSSRHSRFGTSMQTFSADGSLNVSASVMQKSIIQKSSALLKKEFRNPLGSEKKQNMFHNPFFVDLAEGSVRDHNQLNPHVRGSLDDRADHSEKVLLGYRSFLEKCTWMSSLVSILRSSCNPSKPTTGSEFKLPYLLNFVSWFLEFHRCQHALQVAEAKKKNEPPPDLDIAALQGAIDVDMVQFTTARLRDFGKVAQMHQSQLMVALRVLSQQIQTIKVMTECSGSDTRDCGDILVRHLVKEDIMFNVAWIMKNFKTSVHDPRILSYSVEVWQLMILLMNRLHERYDQSTFQVERLRGSHMTRSDTTVEQEVSSLSDSRVMQNLFHLIEKYRRLSAPLQSMLIELIYSIMKAHHTNIVIFFELTCFMRIYRMMTDPLLSNTKNNSKYKDIVGLLEFILESFFQCAQVNSCVFAELLFRKDQQKGEIESTAEFAAILDDYEDETFRRDVLDRYEAGQTLSQLKEKQKEMQKGQPWTEEEDKILMENYQLYADHPLCADLLNSQLPETSRRTVAQVRKRLAELGLTSARGKDKSAEDDRPSKKAKVSELHLEEGEGPAPESPGTPKRHAEQEAEEMLEEDLERLLDSAYDSCQKNAKAAGTAATMLDQSATQDNNLSNLEMEMERMLDEADGECLHQARVKSCAGKAATQGVATTQQEPDSLEMELERMIDSEVMQSREDEKKDQGKTRTQGVATTQQEPDSLEMELERMIDSEVMQSREDEKKDQGKTPTQEEAAEQADSLEMELERMMDSEMSATQDAEKPQGEEPSQEAPRSQHVPDSLELDMERLMDEMSASATQKGEEGLPAEQSEELPAACRAGG